MVGSEPGPSSESGKASRELRKCKTMDDTTSAPHRSRTPNVNFGAGDEARSVSSRSGAPGRSKTTTLVINDKPTTPGSGASGKRKLMREKTRKLSAGTKMLSSGNAASEASRRRLERQERLEYFELLGEAANRVEEAMVMIQLQQQQQQQAGESSSRDSGSSRADDPRRSLGLHNSWRKRSVKPGEGPPVDEMDSSTELALSKIRVQKLLGVRGVGRGRRACACACACGCECTRRYRDRFRLNP